MPLIGPKPTRTQASLAHGMTVLLVLVTLVAAPFATASVAHVTSIMSALVAAKGLLNVMTALLLISRGRITGSGHAVWLGTCFLVAAGALLPHTIVLLGVRDVLADPVTEFANQWVWAIWTMGWLGVVMGVAMIADPHAARMPIKRRVLRLVLAELLAGMVVALVARWLIHVPESWGLTGMFDHVVLPLLLAQAVAAWVLARRHLRPHSVGGAWLTVVVLAAVMEITMRLVGSDHPGLGYAVAGAASVAVQLVVFCALFANIVMVFARMSEANSRLEEMAHSDALTRLANRRRFDERLAREWRRCQRERTAVALVLIDVDHFKQFNDRYGHPAGDECLAQVAALLGAYVRRPADLAARYGGEEFALLLPGIDEAGAARLADRVRLAVRRLGIRHEGSAFGVVTISAGVASIRPIAVDRQPNRLVHVADEALYRAKKLGRDRMCAGATLVHAGNGDDADAMVEAEDEVIPLKLAAG